MSDNLNPTAGLNGFIMGAIVGAGIALLLAPAAGEETRRRLMEGGRKLGGDASDGLNHVKDQVKEKVQELRGHVAEGVSVAKQEVRAASNRIG